MKIALLFLIFSRRHFFNKTSKYRGSPDSTNFVPPGNSTIAKIVLFGDWFSTKVAIYDFWISKVPFFSYFWPAFNVKLWIFPSIYSTFEQLDHSVLVFRKIFSFYNKRLSKLKMLLSSIRNLKKKSLNFVKTPKFLSKFGWIW